MQNILINYDNQEIPAVFLARFHMMDGEFVSAKGLFGRIKNRIVYVDRHYCLAFIPWKHREKELVRIPLSDVTGLEKIIDEDFVSVETYVSSTTDAPWGECEIRDFFGYKFIYEDKNFIADLIDGSKRPYEILYRLHPELLQEEYDEEQ